MTTQQKITQKPKYLITDINVKHDFTFSDALYFDTEQERDIYISSLFFERQNQSYKVIMDTEGKVIDSNDTSDDEATITIDYSGSFKELRKKNYLVIEDEGEFTFWFIVKAKRLRNIEGKVKLTLIRDIIMEYPGIMDKLDSFELSEGHQAETVLFEQRLEAGGRKPYGEVKPLERNFDWNGAFPGKDINTLNNQWIYAFIKTKNTADAQAPLFKYNGQNMPYRVLVAPFNDIVITPGGTGNNNLAFINETWKSSWLRGEISIITDDDLNNDDGQVALLKRERTVQLINEIDETRSIKIAYRFYTASTDVENTIEITQEALDTYYTDRWHPIFLTNQSPEKAKRGQDAFNENREFTENPDGSEPDNFPLDGWAYATFLMLKYNKTFGSFSIKAADRDDDSMEAGIAGFKNRMHKQRDWIVFVPTGWSDRYFTHFDKLGLNNDYDPKYPGWSSSLDGFVTSVVGTEEYSKYYWNVQITQFFQGDASGVPDVVWTKNELVTFINEQANATGALADPVILLGAKISSFNPLELSSDGKTISNIKEFNTTNLGFKESSLLELFKLDSEKGALFNTYDISKLLNKSWINGIENYSIIIEGNKEFILNPDIIYSTPEFVHQIVPTPNEWQERLVFENDIHNSNYEFNNVKEILFATNAFNEYQVNNPNQITNEQSKNNNSLLRSAITIGGGAAITAATGGAAALAIGGGAIIGGTNSALANKQSRKDLKANIADLKEQPVISSGSGSAYGDIYLNKNAFGLTLVEWQYTSVAYNIIETIIRNGLNLGKTNYVNFSKIKRPYFNYIVANNLIEALNKTDIPFDDKAFLANIYATGVRLWYDQENFLNYEVDNGGLLKRDSINYINFNTENQNK